MSCSRFCSIGKQDATPAEGEKIYFVAVLDSQERGYALLARKLYAQDLCLMGEKSDENGMSFAFKPAPKKPFKQIVFRVTEVESCGMQIQISSRNDTLAFDGTKLVFAKGKSKSAADIDRMDPDIITH